MVTVAPGSPDLDAARRLLAFCDASPSPFHACATAAGALEAAGFRRLAEAADWPRDPGRYYLLRGGTLVAWVLPPDHRADDGFRIVGAHTDSPNLRIKPRPDLNRAGARQLGVEAYGGVLLASWMDRDLGLSGRVTVRRAAGEAAGLVNAEGDSVGGGDDTPTSDPLARAGGMATLLRVDRPLWVIPQLAIHLNREVNHKGLVVDAQNHLVPIWGLGDDEASGVAGEAGETGEEGEEGEDFQGFVAAELGLERDDVLGWELMLHDLAPGSLAGRYEEMLGVARLDNLSSCWAGVEALLEAADGLDRGPVPLLCLFDHEEIGSTSERGAASSLLPTLLERIVLVRGGDRTSLARALARSACLSADSAHATHPNYAERHDPQHQIALNAGPVLKLHAAVRYATDAAGSALVRLAAEQADVPLQTFAMRSDLPCGSTIGPVTASRLGVTTVDVGMPQLAMHAAREYAGSHDPAPYRALMAAFLTPHP